MSTTADQLMQFLDGEVRERGVNPSYKTSAKKVLSIVLGSGWERVDISALDVEATLETFDHLAGTRYGATTVDSYKSRFRQAVRMFRERAATTSPRPASTLLEYPVALGRDPEVVARLQVPADLTTYEAQRLSGVLSAVALGNTG